EHARSSRCPATSDDSDDTPGAGPGHARASGWQDAHMTTERMEVQRTIAAEPAAIFGVLRDPQGHVAIDASGMLMDATGEPASGVGDSFTIHMDREALNDFPLGKYDVTIIITKFEPDREIAWTIEGVIKPPIRHVYGYTLEAADGGTVVTSYYDWSECSDEMKAIFPIIPESALRATLGILDRTVARGGPRSERSGRAPVLRPPRALFGGRVRIGRRDDAALEPSEHERPGALDERRVLRRVQELVHLDVRTVVERTEAHVADHLAAGNRHVVVVEVP